MKRNLEGRDRKGNEGRPEACSTQGCSCGRRDFVRKGLLAAGAAAVGSTCKLMVSVKYRIAPVAVRANRPQEKVSISQKMVSHISHVALVYLHKRKSAGADECKI